MSCSGRDYDTPSRICVPFSVQSTEIVRPASGELDIVQDELTNDTKERQYVIPSRNTKTMTTVTEYTSSGSPSSHSSSMSLSSATSTSNALCEEPDDIYLGTKDSCKRIHDAVLRPTRTTFTIGPREDDDEILDEGSSTPASRRVIVEAKGKTPERIQEIPNFPMSRSTNATRGAIGEQKYPGLDDQTSESHEIEDPSTYFLESSSTSSDGEDDGFADLSASVATIRPPDLARTVTEPPESSSSSLVDDVSEPASRATSPNSDQGYTWEVRPPSSIMATPDGEDQDTYDDSPNIPQTHSPQSRSTPSPASSPNSRRQVTVRVSSLPPELLPVPPVASIRVRRPRPPSQDGSQFSASSIRPSSLSDRRSAEYPRANHTSTSTARSPSLSPLAWEATPVPPGTTSSSSVFTSAPVDYLTGSWPSEISGIPNTSPSNPLWSTSPTFRPVSTPTLREVENHTYPQSRRTQFHSTDEAMSSPDSLVSVPVTGLSNPPNPPSASQRTTRFTVPLPPSPGSSLRTSAFNSPFPSGASTTDSWGTPATIPGESVYNQTTSIPGETAHWPDPQPARNSTPNWFPEASANGHNLLWTSVDWPAWSDPTHIPQVAPIPTATPSPPYITPPGYLLVCSYCGSPAPACVCRRYVRVAPVSTGATSGGLRTPIRPPTMSHPTFWFPDGTIIFEVEDVFFKVHKYFFERHSEHFRNLLTRRSAASANIVPVRIPDAKKLDFERLLKVFYPSNLANPDLATVEEWTSVLTLAVKWHMDELISLSIQELTPITSAVDKISLAKKFGLFGYNLAPNSNYNRDWLLPALRELCGRNFPLRFEEARKLDMWTVVKVWEVQHEISNAGLSHNVSQIERLIKRRFGLE